MGQFCDMRGFLAFMVLRMISKKNMSGEAIRREIQTRKGAKPSPGTVYPVLKALSEAGLIEEAATKGKTKTYRITPAGRRELSMATRRFVSMFCDMKDEF